MKPVWNGIIAITQGTVAVATVSTIATLLMLLSTWFHSILVWRLFTCLVVVVVSFTHLVAVFLHRGRLFHRFDFIGMLLVPLVTPFVSVSALHVVLGSHGSTPFRPDEYFLMFLWSFGACLIGIPSVWRIVWLYPATPNDGQGGIFSKPNEPKFRSTVLPHK